MSTLRDNKPNIQAIHRQVTITSSMMHNLEQVEHDLLSWHKRLGHLSIETINFIAPIEIIPNKHIVVVKQRLIFQSCVYSKTHTRPTKNALYLQGTAFLLLNQEIWHT